MVSDRADSRADKEWKDETVINSPSDVIVRSHNGIYRIKRALLRVTSITSSAANIESDEFIMD